ncbi:MAG: prephenate dehydratase, partial [Alphaproteobacteria bacterium]|nr:prephenate dehydratase [Alphaproteobacteria bacterium]
MPTQRTADPKRLIAFQGAHGAYSDVACRAAFPRMITLPCNTFEDAFQAVQSGGALLGMIPVDNSVAGRVADVHRLMPRSGLHIIGEHYERVNHHLLAPRGATLRTVRTVLSHIHALPQCSKFIRQRGLKPVVYPDTAGAAAEVARR